MNTFITPTWVTKDVATNFKNNLKLLGLFDRQWDDSFKNKPEGAQIGYTVQARIQQRFTVSEGQALEQQPIFNQTVPITINHQFHTDMGWSSSQATLEVEEVQTRYTKPAGEALSSKWDYTAGREVYTAVALSVGQPGIPVTSNETYSDAVAKLQNQAVPQEFCAVLDPKSQARILNANLALFNPGLQISQYFRTGQFGAEALGVDDWYYDPLMPTHTTGSFTTSTPAIFGGLQSGSTLNIDGLGTYAFKAGDVFTIDGVNSVNPVSYTDTGDLAQFSVQADLSGTTTAALTISPAIIDSGQLQTVTALPADNAAVNFMGASGSIGATMTAISSRQSLVFHPSAFAFVMADMKSPLAGAMSKRIQSKASGISMRYAEQYNIQTDQNPTRIDTIAGVAPVLPYFAVRVWS